MTRPEANDDRSLVVQMVMGYPDAAHVVRDRHSPESGRCAACSQPYPCLFAEVADRAITAAQLLRSRVGVANDHRSVQDDDRNTQKRPRPVQAHQTGALTPTTTSGVDVETLEHPIPPTAHPPVPPPQRSDTQTLVANLADRLDEIAGDITANRAQPLETATRLAVLAQSARQQAGVQ